MPELPEVEAARVLLASHAVGATIASVVALESGGGPRDGLLDDKVLGEGVTAGGLRSALVGRTIRCACRHGKQMWVELCESGAGAPPLSVLFHFGMTGSLVFKDGQRMQYKSFKVDGTWPPKFTKLLLTFEGRDGADPPPPLAFTDPRRLGRILLRTEPRAEKPIKDLAPDPVNDSVPFAAFLAKIRKSTAAIKAQLLDQNRIVAGVGNWIADEICYQARVHPAAAGDTLSDAQLSAVHGALVGICRAAVAANADYTQFPPEWLFHHRWNKGKATASKTAAGETIHYDDVGGRTSAFVPGRQLKGQRKPDEGGSAAAAGFQRSATAAADAVSAPSTPTTSRRGSGGGTKRKRGASGDEPGPQDATLSPSPAKEIKAKAKAVPGRGRSAKPKRPTSHRARNEAAIAVAAAAAFAVSKQAKPDRRAAAEPDAEPEGLPEPGAKRARRRSSRVQAEA